MINWLANKRIKQLLQPNQGNFSNWEQIHRVALVVKSDDHFTKQAIEQWVNRNKRTVEIFFFDKTAKAPAYNDWHCITSKELRLGLPLMALLKGFQANKYDIVINTMQELDPAMSCIAASLQAPLRCNTLMDKTSPQLIIKRTTESLTAYLDEVVSYLKMIKN
jgi:hypothetical protein